MTRRQRTQFSRSSKPSSVKDQVLGREKLLFLLLIIAFALLLGRFFYLQIVRGDYYTKIAQNQYQQLVSHRGERGKIYSSEGELLVGNHSVYQLYVEPKSMNTNLETAYPLIAPIVLADPEASASLKPLEQALPQYAEKSTRGIVSLANNLSQQSKEALEALDLSGLVFESKLTRFYPEASLAAQTLGFFAKDQSGGYYGIEGGLDKELSGKSSQLVVAVDGTGNPINSNDNLIEQNLDGRDVYLTLRKDIQILLEDTLSQAMLDYGASRGEIIVMEPETGKILGLATSPSYNPDDYFQYDASLYKNPTITDLYEPGSTFKVLTVAAGIDSGMISPGTECTNCSGPRTIDKYTIRNWDDTYHPNITMTEALAESDNTAMMFITDLLGSQRFEQYLRDFGLGQPLNLATQDETPSQFPDVWGTVETATRSFGQGISLSSMQLMRAVGAIANDGEMMQPYLVEKAVDNTTGEVFPTAPTSLGQVISPSTAQTVSAMMQQAAQYGEAQFVYKNTNSIAGKTGTAQIASETGGYEEDATFASFIGFAPYDDPAFLMLVKFERPQSSPWASETAAPTFKELAEKLFIILGVNATVETLPTEN